MQFEALPFEILSQILGRLCAKDLVTISATSRRLRSCSQHSRLWYDLLQTSRPFHPRRDYLEEYIWQHGNLAVNVQSHLAPDEGGIFKALSMFPLHRTYHSHELSGLCRNYLPWASSVLASMDVNLLILACRATDILAHHYDESSSSKHQLLVLREGYTPIIISDLPDWPLCASFIGNRHILILGRFPAMLAYDLLELSQSPVAYSLSSHTVSCMAFDDPNITKTMLICGHYKGRGSMEIFKYDIENGKLRGTIEDRNRFAGVTNIVSCAYLSSGSFVTYDNYSHIYLWTSLHCAARKIDHDGIGSSIPSDMIYKMFYSDRQLVFIDQYKRQYAFVIHPGKADCVSTTNEADGEQHSAQEAEEVKRFLLRQSTDMASLTRRILGF